MATQSRQEAREIIEDIMRLHGGITPADRAATPASVLRSLDSVRKNFAKATTTLSKQLYSKDTRFVYELIQNAEDNTYTKTIVSGSQPLLDFTLSPKQITVDSNEDGFNEENVRAICKLGGSTKTATSGFIGEKGIGFKSVFKIASKVRVQSGPFCFAFEHGDDDLGLGMVTPINEEHEFLPEGIRTRFTLTLNQQTSYEDRITEFQNLPDTLLLFLTKLKKLVVRIHRTSASEISTTHPSTGFGTFGSSTLSTADCTPTGGGIFSADTTPAFGSQNNTGGILFGSGGGVNAVGTTRQYAFGFGSSVGNVHKLSAIECQGTAGAPFLPFQEKDNAAGSVTNHYQTVACMVPYRNFSFEELRLADYKEGSRPSNKVDKAGTSKFPFFPSSSGSTGLSETTFDYSYDETQGLGSLRKSQVGSTFVTKKLYYLHRCTWTGLPEDKARPHTRRAEVVLAFPVNEENIPIIEQQHVFAYLPMRRVGFSFQIQADFITQASREDLFDSAWNRNLLRCIARTFKMAVRRFVRDHPLKYTWIRYLPSRSISDPFWAGLRDMIFDQLKDKDILQSRNDVLSRAALLRHVPQDCLDKVGHPLFLAPSIGLAYRYLSPTYSIDDMALLSTLGLRTLSDAEFCASVHRDLTNEISFFKHHCIHGGDWLIRVIRKLLVISKSNFSLVQDLKCIPLQDGSWVSAREGNIYFPEYEKVPVPTDIRLRLVHDEAMTKTTVKVFFSALGVTSVTPKSIISLIIDKYNTGVSELQSSVAHLRWLYHFLPESDRSLDRRIPLFASDGVPTYRAFVTLGKELRVDDLYFLTDGKFAVQELCRERPTTVPTNGTIGYKINFINEVYLDAVEATVRVHGISWHEWLGDAAGVRRVPRLVKPAEPTKLSELFSWLVLNRPEQIVGTLHAHWSSYEELMKPEITSTLRRAKVRRKETEATALEATWMPTAELKKISEGFDLIDRMPFLDIPEDLKSKTPEDWKFLTKFGVGFEADLRFYLETLRVLCKDPELETGSFPSNIVGIYEAIEKCSNSSQYDEISKFFASDEFICGPIVGQRLWCWRKPGECLWEAPPFIDCRSVLGLPDFYRNSRSVKHLFHDILAIPSIDKEHYVEQLEYWNGLGRVGDIVSVYTSLFQSVKDSKDDASLIQIFESQGLVYVPSQRKWFSPSSCMWAESTRIAGKIAIASEYPRLQNFFVGILHVQKPDKHTYILELAALYRDDSAPSISQVKTLLWEINYRKPHASDLVVVKTSNILPIREATGYLQLRSLEDTFVLFDRESHAKTFRTKVASLDFEIEELRLLRPLIDAFGLSARYTTRLVDEKTRAQDAVLYASGTQDLRSRAHAIFRCAVHYRETSVPKYEDSLYQRLRQIDVHLSHSISSTIKLSLNEVTLTSESDIGRLHLQEDGNHISLYVPQNARERELSYLTKIPERFVSYLGIQDLGAAKVLGDVLRSSLPVLDDVLESHGIVRVPWLVADDSSDNEIHTSLNQSERVSQHLEARSVPEISSSALVEETVPIQNSDTDVPSVQLQSAPLARAARLGSVPVFAAEHTPRVSLDDSCERYRALLDHVIKSAQGLVREEDLSTEVFVPDDVFGTRSTNQLLHDMKIGAAGELYAFEFLLKFLPSLSRSDWRSTIRKHVCVHDKYSDMPSYEGPETADIVYDDVDGLLTCYLIGCGYMDVWGWWAWRNKTPRYFLEVKTTTQDCETRFFMGKAQVKRMERMAIQSVEAAEEVYVIMRVSNLGLNNISLDFIVDPETQRRKGQLRVEAESYTVLHTCASVEVIDD